MGKHGITSYPYDYSLEYRRLKIEVKIDEDSQLPFVIHNGRRLYFPGNYSFEKVTKDYRALITEQDPRSTHRYVRSYNELTDRVLLDVGAAEGIFSLDTIELTRHVFIFECMDDWQRPLTATFAPWKDKVTIIRKYVSDKTSDTDVTLDDFLNEGPKDGLFIKMDIEGAERRALAGARKILTTGSNIQVALCTYHRVGDPEYMSSLLQEHGFEIEFSEGLMYWNKRLSKGVLRGKKIKL
jgi:hypothetical protein